MTMTTDVRELNELLSPLSLEGRMKEVFERFSRPVFTTSLGMEDQVLTWAITAAAAEDGGFRIVTLQTGRLFAETLSLLNQTNARFGIAIEEFGPDQNAIRQYVAEFGVNGFYDSLEARERCCQIRKLGPLHRALKNSDAWVTGLRRGQSDNRQNVPLAEWDDTLQLMKLNPLADWTVKQIDEAVIRHEIPVNPLHGRGYASVGCEPCTRSIKPGEAERAGRWWWEQDRTSECGLHVALEKKPTANTTPGLAKDNSGTGDT